MKMLSTIALFAAAAGIATSSIAATGDPLPITPQLAEGFSGTVADLESRYRLGISPYPNNIFTRTHVSSGEKQIWTGGNYLGLGIQPLTITNGTLSIDTAPLPTSALPIISNKADEAVSKGQINTSQANNIKAARWSSGMVASKTATGEGYYEVRWKLSPVAGRWSAFYLFDWDRGIEVDAVEQVETDQRCFQATTHNNGGAVPAGGTQRICLPVSLSADYHTIGVTLSSGVAIIYVDRIEKARLAMPSNAAGARWNWLVHTAVGGNWLEKPSYGVNNPPAAGSSSIMLVDSIMAPAS